MYKIYTFSSTLMEYTWWNLNILNIHVPVSHAKIACLETNWQALLSFDSDFDMNLSEWNDFTKVTTWWPHN